VEAFIIGSGSHVPERVVTNEEIAGELGLSPEQIFKSSGIRRRRWAAPGTTTSEMAAAALGLALTDAGCEPRDVDYLLLGTMTPDRYIPGSAPAVQRRAGLGEIPCLDLRAACCNTLYGLQLARALVASGAAHAVALCLAEIQSAWLDLSPASSHLSFLFGDGAAALIISNERRPAALEILDVALATHGAYADDLGIRSPGTEFGNAAAMPRAIDGDDFKARMNGQSVILQASRRLSAVCQDMLRRNHLTIGEVGWIVPHQANANLLAQLARNLRFSTEGERVVSLLEDYGNTSSASMGMALDHLRRSNRLREGDVLLLPAFAAGFTWGAGLCRAAAAGD
jgi:3-oxoacyl-[acyl-carrier-protein] synthase-3